MRTHPNKLHLENNEDFEKLYVAILQFVLKGIFLETLEEKMCFPEKHSSTKKTEETEETEENRGNRETSKKKSTQNAISAKNHIIFCLYINFP